MSEADHLSDALVGMLSRRHNGWFTPVVVAIEGLTPQQAAAIPAKGFNCIWGVINHMSYWQEFMLHKLRGEPVNSMRLEGKRNWQKIKNPGDEQAWKTDCENLFAINKELAGLVAGYSDAELDEPAAPGKPRRCQVIQGIVAHNSYHTNEIISIRHMLGLWLEQV